MFRFCLFVVVLTNFASFCLATDYAGGWILPDKQQCVDICTPAANNRMGKNQPGDWDYALIEQIFMPQYCRDLDRGVDITYSHKNVLPFPSGIRCDPNRVSTGFTIHGLWFDYFDGYPTCCPYTVDGKNVPFDPILLEKNYPLLITEMNQKWNDPAETYHDSLCVLYNHEFQKHGTCYSGIFTKDPVEAAQIYFNETLKVTARVDDASKQLDQIVQKQTPIRIADIQKLYSKKVNVLCSNTEPSNQLAVVHTCWNKTDQMLIGEQIDCPPAIDSPLFVTCTMEQDVTVLAYEAPKNHASANFVSDKFPISFLFSFLVGMLIETLY